jgi:hypothetical protein
MPLTAFSIRLDRVDESLLYQAKDGSWWLSCVCTLDEDAKGRWIVAQSIPKERFAAGEKGPQVGYWREIDGAKPTQSGKGFDLSKYRKPEEPASGEPPPAEQSFVRSVDAFDTAQRVMKQPPADPPGPF